ncbi:MAG: hypothetical protein PW789_00815 [Edaphobacter sp.]|uniref:hypothetical protein n=1 Tax=Edaphobacter sp. TaxID=1934404 RepID=UPI00238B8C9E|nr:hypothetical protein [Edaphobacter sp.]MDE1175130.1 hypothetical protein [Edaphobacter sp.]
MNISLGSSAADGTAMDPTKKAKLVEAAQQFEGMLLQELLKPLRSGENDLSGEQSEDSSFDTMSSFGTESVAKAISQSGGLGIARQVIQQVTRSNDTTKSRNITKV